MDFYVVQCFARFSSYVRSMCPPQRHGRVRKTSRSGSSRAEEETGSGLNLAPVSKTRRIQDDYVEISCEATRHLPYLSPGVAIDPISLEPLGEATFTYVTASGVAVCYNVDTLVQYLLYTGDFKDPISRAALRVDDVTQIDECSSSHGLVLPRLTPYYLQRESVTAQTRNRRDSIISLETCIGEIVCDMLKVIETASLYSGNMRLTVLVSEFEVPFSELKREDIEGARQALDGWKAFIRGPPKRPTLDRYGRVDQVLAGLESYWDAGDSSKLDLWRKERGERLLKGIGTDIVLDSNKKDDSIQIGIAPSDGTPPVTTGMSGEFRMDQILISTSCSRADEIQAEQAEETQRDSNGRPEDDFDSQIEMWSQFCA